MQLTGLGWGLVALVALGGMVKCMHSDAKEWNAAIEKEEAIRRALDTDPSPITLVAKEKIQQAGYRRGGSDVGFLHYDANEDPNTIEFTARVDFGNVTETARFQEEKVGKHTKVSVVSGKFLNFQNVTKRQ